MFENLSKRIHNLEEIFAGKEISEKSFAPAAQRKHIKLAVAERNIAEILERLNVTEGHGRYLESAQKDNKNRIDYLNQRCNDNEEGIDDLVYYLKREAGEDYEEENSKRLTDRFSRVVESPRYRNSKKEEDSKRSTAHSSTMIVSPLDRHDEKNLDSTHNLLQEQFSDRKGKEKRKTTT